MGLGGFIVSPLVLKEFSKYSYILLDDETRKEPLSLIYTKLEWL